MSAIFRSQARQAVQAVTAAVLCAAFSSTAIAVPAEALPPATPPSAPLTAQKKALHTLNRFTFGPRPGDVASVLATGPDAWFERQLHPERIDDSAFEHRLDNDFPAMKLSQAELLARFPGPQRLRQLEQRDFDPIRIADPVERAIYTAAMGRYQLTRKLQEQGKTPADAAMMMQAGQADETMASMNAAAPDAKAKPRRAPLQELLADSTLTRNDIDTIIALPPTERFQRIVSLPQPDLVKFGLVAQRQRDAVVAGLTPVQKEALGALANPERLVAAETLETRLLRDVSSERQLQAVMADFWLNHFSVYVRKNQFEPYLLNSYQRDTILPNALGNFEQLLVATAKSPAMLVYLDNWQSIGPDSDAARRGGRFGKQKGAPQGINENYARELMELHTVGVNGGYTQKDVIEVAKCFTGWTVDRPYAGGGAEFHFEPARHEGGSKTVLGVKIPEGGMQEGLTVLHMLATSPKTAHFISQKLAVRFVADNPPPALVNRMAATFLESHGDLKAVLETMYHSPEFWSPAVYRAKVKTPVEFLTSAVRASGVKADDPALLVVAAERLGMPVYGMQTPNGYSWQSSDWVSTGALVNRMNFALVLSGSRIRGMQADWPQLAPGADPAAPTPATEQQLEAAILGQPASQHTRDTVLAQFRNPTVQHEAQQNFALAESREDDTMQTDNANMPRPARKSPAAYFRGAGNGLNLNADAPESPLDTMAGLLLGSPDFQRR